jgi:hypothetical protein
MKILPKIHSTNDDGSNQQQRKLYNDLLRHEAKIGGQLFGPLPKDHNRQFFYLGQHTWIWHEEWINDSGRRQVVTTRYEIRPNDVIKAQDGRSYQRLTRDEARNLYRSIQLYMQRIHGEYQQILQASA